MRGKRRKAREAALQLLYRVDLADGTEAESAANLEDIAAELSLPPDSVEYAAIIVEGIAAHSDEVDTAIAEFAENWTVDRMAVVDRNVLRIAAFELMHLTDVPYRVVIDEAVELAKLYGTEESGAFVNGILDKLASGLDLKDAAATH